MLNHEFILFWVVVHPALQTNGKVTVNTHLHFKYLLFLLILILFVFSYPFFIFENSVISHLFHISKGTFKNPFEILFKSELK